MSLSDYETLAKIYTRLQTQTDSVNQVGYEDALQQALYFEVLTVVEIPPTATVLDVGCGHGDLYAYLLANGFEGCYVGLDLIPHFIEQARQRFPQASFVLGDIASAELDPCDYALASGPFDYRTPNSEKRWHSAIVRMFELAHCGVAWNGLSDVPPERTDLWPQPLPKVIELCASLSPYYSIRCDYDPLHFTAYVYKRKHFYSENLLALIGHLFLHPEYAQELENNPLGCAAQFGTSLQQLNIIAPLWATQQA